MAQRLTRLQRGRLLLATAVKIANQNDTVMVTYDQIAVTQSVSIATVRGYFGNRDNLWEMIARDDAASEAVKETARTIGIL